MCTYTINADKALVSSILTTGSSSRNSKVFSFLSQSVSPPKVPSFVYERPFGSCFIGQRCCLCEASGFDCPVDLNLDPWCTSAVSCSDSLATISPNWIGENGGLVAFSVLKHDYVWPLLKICDTQVVNYFSDGCMVFAAHGVTALAASIGPFWVAQPHVPGCHHPHFALMPRPHACRVGR